MYNWFHSHKHFNFSNITCDFLRYRKNVKVYIECISSRKFFIVGTHGVKFLCVKIIQWNSY